MKRRTLDIIFASGGLMVAVLLAALGLALLSQYAFATDYVKEELSAQKIVFPTADKLTTEETTWKAGSACLVTYAGQTMETGPQAECYAKYYLAKHMDTSAKTAGFPGATYATLGGIRTDLSAQIAAAKAKSDTTGAADLQKKLDTATSLRTTMQTGETLRGLLLTVYGFSSIGEKGGLAANLLFGLAGLMGLLSVAGFVHAFATPKEKVIFAPGTMTKVPSPAH
jgi:hypothetical protein